MQFGIKSQLEKSTFLDGNINRTLYEAPTWK